MLPALALGAEPPHPEAMQRPLGIAGNPLLAWGVAFELALLAAIVYTCPGQIIFGTAPLPAILWLVMLPMAALITLLEEGRKAWLRRDADGWLIPHS